MVILVAWPLVGLAIAYPFGSFLRGAEALGNASDLMPPIPDRGKPGHFWELAVPFA